MGLWERNDTRHVLERAFRHPTSEISKKSQQTPSRSRTPSNTFETESERDSRGKRKNFRGQHNTERRKALDFAVWASRPSFGPEKRRKIGLFGRRRLMGRNRRRKCPWSWQVRGVSKKTRRQLTRAEPSQIAQEKMGTCNTTENSRRKAWGRETDALVSM